MKTQKIAVSAWPNWVFALLVATSACNGVGHPEGDTTKGKPDDREGDAGSSAPEKSEDGNEPGAVGDTHSDPAGNGDPNPDSSLTTPSGPEGTTPASPSANAPSPDLGDTSGPGALPPGTDPGGVDIDCEADPGVSPLLRLSTVEYRNTLRDLLSQSGLDGIRSDFDETLALVPDDSLGESFRSLDDRVSAEHIDGYFKVGVAVGDRIAADSNLLQAVAGECAMAAELSAECAQDFLVRFLGLAYRRPATEAEVSELLALSEGRTASDAVRAMIVVSLSSPRFVNHFEIDGTANDERPDVLQLTSFEIASRLSYTFWRTMPDAELMSAAEDGSLATPAGFDTQLERVFADARTRETLWQFWNEWLRFEKFTGFETTRPGFEALSAGTAIGQDGHDYYRDMVQEVRDLTELFTFDREAKLADLVTTDISVTRSADLAALYGVEPYAGSGEYPTLPAGTRGGLFQRAALLVSNLEATNPFHRGAFIRRSLLCDELPQPDPNSLPPGSLDPPPMDAAQTTRERYDAKVAGNGLCQGCHASFSNIGYVLESFDALGRYRAKETVYDEETGDFVAELDLNTRAVARIDPADDSEVSDAIDLNERLAASGKVESCLASRYFSYAAHRAVDTSSSDACVVQDLASLLGDPAQGLSGAFRRLARHDDFFQRKVGPR